MHKLFLSIYFCIGLVFCANAAVREVINDSEIPQRQSLNNAPQKPKEVSLDEMENFLSERIEKAVVMDKDEVSSATTDTQPSDIYLKDNQEANKTTFQKIYENALKRLDNKKNNVNPQAPSSQNMLQQHKDSLATKPENLNFPTINVNLPFSGKAVRVPAQEHIPYLMSKIELLPEGSVKFTETVMVIANNQKLKEGLTRNLPKYIVSRNNDKRKISYTLIGVSVNGENIPYVLDANLNNIIIRPQDNLPLEAGVYTYKFEYMAHNLLWSYADFKEFYWDISGSSWDLAITRSGATLALPEGVEVLGQLALVGNAFKTDDKPASVMSISPQNWGYVASRALLPFESVHLIVSLADAPIIEMSIDDKIMFHFNNHADFYISLATLIAIALSFGLSWKYIRANKGQLKITLKKTPVLVRFLAFNRYDIKSFGGFLLDLYRKNIIDIQQNESTILLVKRTDNLKSLNLAAQKAMGYLFTQNEPVLNVNKNNRLKIMRAAKVIEKDLRKTLFAFLLKLNSGYLFFSLGMMLTGIGFISLMEVNSGQIFAILCCGSATIGLGIFLFTRPVRNMLLSILLKALGVAMAIIATVCLAAIVSLWCIGFIIAGLLAIYHYTTAYAQRNGLLKSYIEDIAKMKENLLLHKDNIMLSKDIINQQPYIWVLDLENEFISNLKNEYNKLPALKMVISYP